MQKNRIDDLIKKGIKDPASFEKELSKLEKKAHINADFKKELYREFKESLGKTGETIMQLSIRKQMESVLEIVSISYIAKTYFSKSRQWLHHRINGNIVNGKPATFTPGQLKTLQSALKDISKKIDAVRIAQ